MFMSLKNGIGLDVDYDCGGNSSYYYWYFEEFENDFHKLYDKVILKIDEYRN